MERATVGRPARKSDSDYRADLERLVADIDGIISSMAGGRDVIARLRAESIGIATRTDARIADIQKALDEMKARA